MCALLTAIFENYVAEIRLDGKPVQLALWDTAYVTSLGTLLLRSFDDDARYQRAGRV
jgi:hypothetical protein